MSAPPVLEVRGLCGGYGKVPVLHDLSFTAEKGETVGMLGHNGMGKTTLLKHLVGLLPTTAGEVTLNGRDITASPTHERSLAGIGYVPQGSAVFPGLSTLDNLRFAWTGAEEAEERALHRVLADFPRLAELLPRKADHLSGGEKQQLAIARCLMADPLLLLLDEPTEGIQPSIIDEIIEALTRIRKERGLTILLVEQNLDFLSALAGRLLILERGRIRAEVKNRFGADAALIAEFTGFGEAAEAIAPVAPQHHAPEANAPLRVAVPSQPPTVTPPQPPVATDSRLQRARAAGSNNSTMQSQPGGQVPMTIQRPGLDEMRRMASSFGMQMSDSELMDYLQVMEPYVQGYDTLAARPDNLPQVRYPRAPGMRPQPEDNPLGAWYVKCEVHGAATGPLVGKRIVLKDTVCLAGVPMMNGSSVMEGYIPELDATIVTRLLDAGAVIVGKATNEYLCLSGGSHTSDTGPVHNPWKRGYMAGGSSSGSAALVAAGEVDMAIAGDQGGSIRIPSSNCGTYGMKATHGLVPYSGVFPIEQTVDHVGPITSNVADNALMLEVLAGADGLDPRQYKPRVERYTDALRQDVRGLRIGVLTEGFGRPESETDVDHAVRSAIEQLRQLGAVITEVSIPEHLQAPAYWTAIIVEGLQDLMMHGNAGGTNYRGLYIPGMMDYFARWRQRSDELPASVKVCMFLGEYFQNRYHGKFYGKAHNLMRAITARYDQALRGHDLLLLPTLPMKAQPLPPPDASLSLYVQRAFEMVGNTCPFNVSGHPAMSLPCGISEGLPIGMMLVANHYGENTIYRAAHAFEQSHDWRQQQVAP